MWRVHSLPAPTLEYGIRPANRTGHIIITTATATIREQQKCSYGKPVVSKSSAKMIKDKRIWLSTKVHWHTWSLYGQWSFEIVVSMVEGVWKMHDLNGPDYVYSRLRPHVNCMGMLGC